MRVFTQQELSDILLKHSKYLKGEQGGKCADLSYANLRYANLRSADLRYANLRYADLRYANLRYADLRYANLRYANLRSADLRYANLRYANLIYFCFNQHVGYFTFDGKIRIGCEHRPIKLWASKYKSIGKANGYSKEETEAYGVFIKLCKSLQVKHDRKNRKNRKKK